MSTDLPTPPDHPGLSWRPLTPEDEPALAALEAAGVAADGGLPQASDAEFVRERYALDAAPGASASLGAWRPDGTLAAATGVRRRAGKDGCRALVAGLVHPDARRQGRGDFLMRWALAQAQALLAGCPAGAERAIILRTESRNPPADALYARYGLHEIYANYVMLRDLDRPLPAAPWPDGFTQAGWSAERAPLFFEAYHAAFRERPGFPGYSAEEWIDGVTQGNDDLSPERTRVVLAGDEPVAMMINAANWVVQIGVRPEWRGRGIAQALVVQLMAELQADGAAAAWLTVGEDNPRAFRVYEQLGFVVAGRRARYSREVS
jgi:ribosomal protein S18 acetylase RimI-like enzyme